MPRKPASLPSESQDGRAMAVSSEPEGMDARSERPAAGYGQPRSSAITQHHAGPTAHAVGLPQNDRVFRPRRRTPHAATAAPINNETCGSGTVAIGDEAAEAAGR